MLRPTALGSAPIGAFGGNFSGQELLEIVRLIALGEKDGVLTIHGTQAAGQVGFARGEVLRAHTGDLNGAPAAYALLSLPSGHFEFTAGNPGGEQNCHIRAEELAMEVARRLDEGATKHPPGAPPGGGGLSGNSTTLLDPPTDPIARKRLRGPDPDEGA
jgi:hypothetical protein